MSDFSYVYKKWQPPSLVLLRLIGVAALALQLSRNCLSLRCVPSACSALGVCLRLWTRAGSALMQLRLTHTFHDLLVLLQEVVSLSRGHLRNEQHQQNVRKENLAHSATTVSQRTEASFASRCSGGSCAKASWCRLCCCITNCCRCCGVIWAIACCRCNMACRCAGFNYGKKRRQSESELLKY